MKRTSPRLTAGALFACATLALGLVPAGASAPMSTAAQPGFFRMHVGAFEVTALNDGTLDLPADKLLIGESPAAIKADLARSDMRTPVTTSIDAYLVNTGAKLVLVDTGIGGAAKMPGMALDGGHLLPNMKAAGYAPENVDAVVITHEHGDHIGGLVNADGTRVFPNATLWVHALDAKAPDAQKAFKPYADAGMLKTFTTTTQIVPGVSAVPAVGHTPGHTTFTVESNGQRLRFWGDLIHVAAVQFPHPNVAMGFDSNKPQAVAQRAAALREATSTGEWVAASHLPFPGIGHIVRDGAAYRWVPVNYTL